MRSARLGWVLAAFLLLGGSPGCREPEVTSESPSTVCPTCKDQTKVMPLLGLEYESHTCPKCHSTSGPGFPDLPYETVHYCERCRKIVEDCPQCRSQAR